MVYAQSCLSTLQIDETQYKFVFSPFLEPKNSSHQLNLAGNRQDLPYTSWLLFTVNGCLSPCKPRELREKNLFTSH